MRNHGAGEGATSAEPKLPADWLKTVRGFFGAAAVAMTVNVTSEDAGYRWAMLLLGLWVAVEVGFWLRRLHSQTTLARWFGGLCLAFAAVAAGVSVLGPSAWATYSAALSAVFVVAVLARSQTGEAMQVLAAVGTIAIGLTVMISGGRAMAIAPLFAPVVFVVGVYILMTGIGHFNGNEALPGMASGNRRENGQRYLLASVGFLGCALMCLGRYPLGVVASLGLAATYAGGGLVLLKAEVSALWTRITTPPAGRGPSSG